MPGFPRVHATASTPWQNLAHAGRLSLWLLVTLRLGLEALGLLSIRFQPVTEIGGDWLNLLLPGPAPWSTALSLWQRWDALWYQQIAEHGYQAGNSTAAFYPLYPLLARLAALPLGGHIVLAELVVTSAAFVAAIWLLYTLALKAAGADAACLTVLLTALFPVGFFLLAPYTEALYLALSVATFLLSFSGRPWLAGLAGLAAALTRAQGAVLALPLAYNALAGGDKGGIRARAGLLAAGLPPLGFAAVLAYDRFAVHETRVGLSALAAWGYQVVPPWTAVADSWREIIGRQDPIEALNLACLVGFALLAIFVTRRLPAAYALYTWPYLAVLATRQAYFSPLISVSRYMLVLFPCFIILGMWLARRPWLSAGWLVISIILQAVLFQYWVHFGFVA
jgi:hypothetical protein